MVTFSSKTKEASIKQKTKNSKKKVAIKPTHFNKKSTAFRKNTFPTNRKRKKNTS